MRPTAYESILKLSSNEQLAHFRRTVARNYARVRDAGTPLEKRWLQWRYDRDQLISAHPQSSLDEEQKKAFCGLEYYPYNPELRYTLEVDYQVEAQVFEVPLRDDGLMRMQRFGKLHFNVGDEAVSLSLFWILGYGGGIFLPFRDKTNDEGSYGGGRYLLDTLKNADLGQEEGRLVIDFNFAYNPSCAYNPRWHCPLAPIENWLPVPIQAGEKSFS